MANPVINEPLINELRTFFYFLISVCIISNYSNNYNVAFVLLCTYIRVLTALHLMPAPVIVTAKCECEYE